jgi:ubiquinone/menaquinone biosynthesis C-methylase UbiE
MRVHRDWDELALAFRKVAAASVAEWVASDKPHHAATLEFATHRLDEGRRLMEFFTERGLRGRVLDVGSGNGGVALGMANSRDYEVVTVDLIPNRDVLRLRASVDVPLRATVGSGHHLPFADASFDLVLCLDTIEHVPQPERMGREIMRVLRPSGVCMLTTPPRAVHLLRRDPHYAIPLLAMLPDGLQRFVAASLLKRTDSYDVEHLFWSVGEIARCFEPHGEVEVLYRRDFSRRTLLDRALWRVRDWMWDRVLLWK